MPYGLSDVEVCELTRVALGAHATPVSRLIAIALRFLARRNPKLRLVVSFADPAEDHHGGIYQAGNWIYAGETAPSRAFVTIDGRRLHSRQVSPSGRRKQFGCHRIVPRPAEVEEIRLPGKHRYLMPLDGAMRERVAPLAKPYPKRAKQAMADDRSAQRRGSTDRHAPILEGVPA